jgi:hypothetical protein
LIVFGYKLRTQTKGKKMSDTTETKEEEKTYPVVKELQIGGMYSYKPSQDIARYGGIGPDVTFLLLDIEDAPAADDGKEKKMLHTYYTKTGTNGTEHFKRKAVWMVGIHEFLLHALPEDGGSEGSRP